MKKARKYLSEAQLAARRKGGKAGGRARAKALSIEERKKIAAMGGAKKGKNYATRKKISESLKKTLSKLTPEELSERAMKAVQAREKKKSNPTA
jgi:hypothetical protein